MPSGIEDAGALATKAAALLADKKYALAANKFTDALELGPDTDLELVCLHGRAQCRVYKGKFDAGIEDCTTVLNNKVG